MKNALVSTKNFVVKHKTPIVAIAASAITAVAVGAISNGALESHVDFLQEKGLSDDYLNWIAEGI